MSKKITTCFLSPYAYPLFHPQCDVTFGGAEVQMYLLANALAGDARYAVHFLVADFGQKKEEMYGDVRVHAAFAVQRTVKFFSAIPAYIRLWLCLRSVDADVYIHRAFGVEVAVIGLYCFLYRKRFIYMTSSSIECNGKLRNLGFILYFMHLFGMRLANQLLAQNGEDQEALRRTYGLSSAVFRNSISMTEYLPRDEKEFILWVSSCQPLKQPHIFLDLADAFPNEQFVIVLSPRKEFADLYERIMTRAAQQKNVRFVGHVPFRDIDRYYAKAKFFVNTSTFEGFPNTFLQVAKQGAPILSLIVNPDGVLTGYDMGYAADGDINQFFVYARRLIADTVRRKIMGEHAYDYTREHHDIKKNIEHLKRFIERSP